MYYNFKNIKNHEHIKNIKNNFSNGFFNYCIILLKSDDSPATSGGNATVTTLFTTTNQGDVDGTIDVAKIKSIKTIITDAENNIIFQTKVVLKSRK